MSSIWCKDINFYQYSFRLILLWSPKSLVFFSEIQFCRYFFPKLWFAFLSPDRLTSCSSSTDLNVLINISATTLTYICTKLVINFLHVLLCIIKYCFNTVYARYKQSVFVLSIGLLRFQIGNLSFKKSPSEKTQCAQRISHRWKHLWNSRLLMPSTALISARPTNFRSLE